MSLTVSVYTVVTSGLADGVRVLALVKVAAGVQAMDEERPLAVPVSCAISPSSIDWLAPALITGFGLMLIFAVLVAVQDPRVAVTVNAVLLLTVAMGLLMAAFVRPAAGVQANVVPAGLIACS